MKILKKYILLLLLLLIPTIVSAYNISEYETYITVTDDNIAYREILTANFDKNTKIEKKLLNKEVNDIIINSKYEKVKNSIIIDSLQYKTHKYSIKHNFAFKASSRYKVNIGNTYNTNVRKTTFNIELPKDVSKDNVTFYLNNKKLDIDYEIINKRIIYGTYDKTLKENDKLIVEINYTNINHSTILFIISIIAPLTFVLVSYILWRVFGKDLGIKLEKSNTVPKRLDILELSLMYNGRAGDKDLVYMILDLAERGYIKIEETNKTFKLIRLKQYTGTNEKESILFKSIFKKYNSTTLSEYINSIANKENKKIEYLDEITVDDLKLRLKKIRNDVLSVANSQEERSKYFEKDSDSKKIILSIMLTMILLLVTSIPFIENNQLTFIPISVIFSIVTLAEIINLSDKLDMYKLDMKKILLTLLVLVGIWIILLVPILNINKIFIISYIVGTISTLVITVLYKYMPKRTVYATKEMGKVEGFKKYLNTAKDKEIKELIKDNSNYLYEQLPYTYIIGCKNKIINKMTLFKTKAPEWYELNSDFTPKKLSNSIDRLIKTMFSDEK